MRSIDRDADLDAIGEVKLDYFGESLAAWL